MDPLTLQTLLDYSGGTCLNAEPITSTLLKQSISAIQTDSRAIQPGEFFIALVGENFDGHEFVPDVLVRGAAGVIVNRTIFPETETASLPNHFVIIGVDDTLIAFQKIAAAYRKRLKKLKVVAVTGTCGKTSVKDFTATVLEQRFKTLKTIGNKNNHIGVPQMLLKATSEDEIAVLEMGMNHAGELAPLVDMAQPIVGMITNIGFTHIEFLKTQEAIAKEKETVIRSLPEEGTAILKADDQFSETFKRATKANVVTVGLSSGHLQAEILNQDITGSSFRVFDKRSGKTAEAFLPVPGLHMIENALFAIAAGMAFNIPLPLCAKALANVTLTSGRLQMKEIGGLHFIDDTYNAGPESVIAGLKTLSDLEMSGNGRRVAILGKMGELGEFETESHQRVGKATAELNIDVLIGVGPLAELIVESAKAAGLQNTYWVETPLQASELILSIPLQPEDITLVKGSRSAKMENIFTTLPGFSEELYQVNSHH